MDSSEWAKVWSTYSAGAGRKSARGTKAAALLGDLGYQRLMAVADHGVDAGQRGELVRRPLRIAAGDQDARGGVFPPHAAQEGAGGAVRLGGHSCRYWQRLHRPGKGSEPG